MAEPFRETGVIVHPVVDLVRRLQIDALHGLPPPRRSNSKGRLGALVQCERLGERLGDAGTDQNTKRHCLG